MIGYFLPEDNIKKVRARNTGDLIWFDPVDWEMYRDVALYVYKRKVYLGNGDLLRLERDSEAAWFDFRRQLGSTSGGASECRTTQLLKIKESGAG